MNVSPRTYRNTPPKKKRTKCSYCNITYAFLSLAYMVSCFAILIFMHYNTIQNEDTFDAIQMNWDQPMIDEIKISKSSYSCPTSHPIILSKYHFPGTIEGCKCSNGGYDVHKCCFTGMCSENETCHGTDVDPVQETDLIVWEADNQKFILCGKAISQFKMNKFNEYMNEDGTCKDNDKFKLCETQDKDINKNICVPKSEQCPIRSIKIQNISKNILKNEENNNEVSGNIIITDNVELIYYRDSDRYPAVQFQIDDGFGICMNPEYRYLGVRNDYLLTKTKRQVQVCTVDPTWEVVDALTQLEFYEINNHFEKEVEHLPEFNVSDYYKQQLIYKGYNAIKNECRKYFSEELTKKQDENFRQMSKDFKSVIDTSASLFLVIGMMIIYFGCFEVFLSISYRPKTHYGLVFYNKMKSQKLFSGAKFVGLLFKVGVGLAFVIKTFVLNKDALDIRSAAEHYIKQECFDESLNDFFQHVQGVLRGSYFTFMLVGWIFIAIFEPNVTYWMRRKMMGRLISDEEDSDEYILPDENDKDDYQLQKKSILQVQEQKESYGSDDQIVSYVEMRNTNTNQVTSTSSKPILSNENVSKDGDYKQPDILINKNKSTDYFKSQSSGESPSPRMSKSNQHIPYI